MIGYVGCAPALLHQLAQRQRSPPPEGLREYMRGREGHLHSGKRSALAPHEKNDRRLEDSEGDTGVLGNGKICNLNTKGKTWKDNR